MQRFLALLLVFIASIQGASAAYLPSAVQFGGNGVDGPVVKSGTVTGPEMIDATSFTVSGTYNCDSGTRINSLGNVVISGTINVGAAFPGPPAPAQGAGNAYYQVANGGGPGGGASSAVSHQGGNGGGFGGRGGRAGIIDSGGDSVWFTNICGGLTYPPSVFPSGSAGGSGMFNHSTLAGVGGAGGAAGGCIRIYSGKSISISGQINCNGGDGTTPTTGGTGSGGGGGSGGLVVLAALESITISSSNGIQVKGGNAGNGLGSGSAGGGGGGGYVVLVAPTVSVTGTINSSGGSKGTNTGSVNPPTDGSTGQTLIIQKKPSLPLLALFQDEKLLADLVKVSKIKNGFRMVSSNDFDLIARKLKRAA